MFITLIDKENRRYTFKDINHNIPVLLSDNGISFYAGPKPSEGGKMHYYKKSDFKKMMITWEGNK